MWPWRVALLVTLTSLSVPASAAPPAREAAAPARPGGTAAAASVYRVSLPIDLSLTASASLAILLPYVFSSRLIMPRCPCDPAEVNPFDRVAIGHTSRLAGALSDLTVGAVLVVPLVLDSVDLGVDAPLFDDALVFAETLAVNGALVTATKYLVQRPLPRTYAGEPRFVGSPSGYRAFYSGHTSLAFAGLSAVAMTLRLRHGERIWPWIMTLVVGGSVAFERVADGRHFPSDVIVGALVGSAVGIVVPWLHERPRSSRGELLFTPSPDGLGLSWVGRF